MSAEAFRDLWENAEGGREYSLLVTGFSMRPSLLHARSVVYIQKMTPQIRLKRGDIVLFQRSCGDFVLHRIAKVNKDGMLCMNGDAQNWKEWIRAEQVAAKVTRICRTGRTFSAEAWYYRVYAAVWQLLFPMRPVLLKLWGKFAEILH